jgi:mono/diheme cytochrome c family protein
MKWILPVLALAAASCEMNEATRQETKSQPVSSFYQKAHWIVNPNSPGENLPRQGRSLFDYLVADGVPFPFSRLIERIKQHAAGVKVTLIPLGRSLQRSASAPDFFAFPRFIVAVDGDHARSQRSLKDRLFLGYNEKSAVIEVISYNEIAGRFEFQVVKDYREGGTPRLVYANRAVCVSCHQNAGPIFSRPLWDETNANSLIAANLAQARRDFHGASPESGVDTPNEIDDATDRANLFSLYQLLWRDGCEDDVCRGDLLLDLLRYRLAGKLDAEKWAKKWSERWPDGIALSNPDIPNRDPLIAGKRNDVAADDEALQLRPPLQVWDARSDAARSLAGFSEFMADGDVVRFDEWLLQEDTQTKQYESKCGLSRSGDALAFDCNGAFSMSGRMRTQNDEAAKGTVDRLALNGDEIRDLKIAGGHFDQLRLRRGDLSARLGDNAIEQLQLDPQHCAGDCPGEVVGIAVITVREDLSLIAPAISRLLGEGTLSGTFHPSRIIRELIKAPPESPRDLPPARLDPPGSIAAFKDPGLQALQRTCGNCHHSNDRFPPNFLTGDAAAVERKIAHCAERMYVRLAVNDVPPANRAKTPMPPAGAQEGLYPRELSALRDYVGGVLKSQRGAVPSLDELLRGGYENLRECLPS